LILNKESFPHNFSSSLVSNIDIVDISILEMKIRNVCVAGNPEFGSKFKGVYGHTLFLSKCFGLPCIATQICLNYGIQKEVAYLHLGFTALPVIAHLFKDRSKKNLLDGVIFSNLISVAYFSYANANYYGTAMLVSYSVNNFMIGTDGTAFDTSIPSLDLFMYGLSFFNFFAIKTLTD